MIHFYGRAHKHEFPKRDSILRTLNNGDVAVIVDKDTECQYIFTNQMGYWTQVSELASIPTEEAKWIIVMDNFDDGHGNQGYPHCSRCGRGVYRHDAGMWCPFCGASIKNPMRC